MKPTTEQFDRAVAAVRGSGVMAQDLTVNAKILYVVGALIATEDGTIERDTLEAAVIDPDVHEAAARVVMVAAGALS